MPRRSRATNTHRMIILSLYEGWVLRYVDHHGWCLFQPGRSRPFAHVRARTVRELTEQGWLTPGTMPQGAEYRPAKDLTSSGRRFAEKLVEENWAACEWSPGAATAQATPENPRASRGLRLAA